MAERAVRDRRAFLPAFPRVSVSLPRPLAAVLVALATVVGAGAIGWLSVAQGPIPATAILAGLVAAVVVSSDPRAGVWAVVAVMTLLPFAVIPVRVGLTLTLFEAAAIGALGVWGLRLLLRRDERIVSTAPAALIVLLLALTLFAFLLGIHHAYTSQTFHDYGKFVLAVLVGFVVWNTTYTLADARRLTAVLLLGASAAAAIGLALYAGGPGLTLRVLSRLIPYGYPSDRIVRYIEDDPARPMRLISTSVDPNSFGGLLAVTFVLAVAMAIARQRLLPRWLTVPAIGLLGAALLLTLSRGAWVGAAAGLAVLTVLRYRWLILPGGLLAAAALLLGIGASFIHRLYLGLTLQDAATRLRLMEYRNALAIIRAHPVFGVGFGEAPSITLQTGVSSIYLTIAERTGLLGLGVFLITVGAIALAGLRCWRRQRETAAGDLTLGLLAALATALTVGVFDHYFFNISFPHMVALFWLVCGLLLALAYPPKRVR
ncbi:MAG: O-antigen ligase family protein [Sphaerobacter sp.]|nr:O-antigen ligase family protein [Sphaerobacter sp.]